MKGVYRFYQDGALVGEVENLITTAGKTYVMKYLAGYVGSIARGMAIGLGATTATVADSSLAFEWNRVPILMTSADYANTAIVFRGQIPAALCGSIYEVGLWSLLDAGQIYGSRLLFTFDSASETWSAGTWQTTTDRIGVDNLRLAPATSGTLTSTIVGLSLDLSGYSALDEFRLAYNVNSAFVATAKVILYTDASNYFTYTITAPGAGYTLTAFHKSDCAITGAPSWANITSMAVQVTSTSGGSGSIDFDAFRMEDKDLNSEQYVFVSRAVPATPIVKLAGSPLDFEYSLDVTL